MRFVCILANLLLFVYTTPAKPQEMRETRWVTTWEGATSSTFNRPQCDNLHNFNATCIGDGTTLKAIVYDPFPESYILSDAEFNVYGVTGDGKTARGFNVFVDFGGWRWYVPTFSSSCIAKDKLAASSLPVGNRSSPLNDKMVAAPVYLFLQDPLNTTKFCITKLEVRLKGTLVDPDISDWGPQILYVHDEKHHKEDDDVVITLHGNNLGRRSWNCLWSISSKQLLLPGTISLRSPDTLLCSIPSELLKDLSEVSLFLKPEVYWGREKDYGPFIIALPEPPVITSVTPFNGTTNGGTKVTVKGSGFLNIPTAIVKFGPAYATDLVVIDAYTITCNTPAWFPEYDFSSTDALVNGTTLDFLGSDYDLSSVISVSFDGQFFEASKVRFEYQFPPPAAPVTPEPQPPNPNPVPDPWDWLKRNIWIPVLVVLGVFALIFIICWSTLRREEGPEYERLENGDFAEYGTVFLKSREIELKERIGRGKNTYVYRAIWGNREVAVKRLRYADVEGKVVEIAQEVTELLDVRHNAVVSFLGLILDVDNSGGVSVVTEYLPRGSLYYLLLHYGDEILDDLKLNMALDACKGMEYLHTINVLHGDLKTKNLLVGRNWEVKVADAGLTKFFGVLQTPYGSPGFTDPEVLAGNKQIGKESDVYSFGMTMYELWVSLDPWKNLDDSQIITEVVKKGKRPRVPSQTPGEITEIILSCWDEISDLRPTFSELVRRLDSVTFVKKIDIANKAYDMGSSPGWMGNISSSVGVSDFTYLAPERGSKSLDSP